MDGALSSDRHRGRGRGRGRRQWNPRDDGRGRYGGRRGGRGTPANRPLPREPPERQDPRIAMEKQLTAMMAKMGELEGAADAGGGEGDVTEERPVVKAIGRNVQDLVAVLCSPSHDGLFLRFGDDDTTEKNVEGADDNINNCMADQQAKPINASAQAGSLASLLISCATNLPLQTPSYAALTLGVECSTPSSHHGFASRCLELGIRCLGRDLDGMLGCRLLHDSQNSASHLVENNQKDDRERCQAERTGGQGNGSQIDAYYRAKFMLRYLAHLAMIGIISSGPLAHQQQDQIMGTNLSLLELLQLLVRCACNSASAASSGGHGELRRASLVLSSLVLSTIPYLDLDISKSAIIELLEDLEAHIFGQSYSSDYEPGIGWLAVLLKGELDDGEEEPGEGTGDDDDEEEEDETCDPMPSCADTLQDLMRTVRSLVNAHTLKQGRPCRFALLRDAPWNTLKSIAESSEDGMEDREPMNFVGDPLTIDLVGGEEDRRCIGIPFLLSFEQDHPIDDSVELNLRLTDGVLFGRLAIFDAPPDPDDDEDDIDEDQTKESDQNLRSYINSYSLIDRFFLSDTIRDVLMCHRPMMSDAGADRSTAKEVAEQIWMISHLLHPAQNDDSDDASKGIEYGIVETLLSLIVQATPRECSVPASSPLHQHIYISRVLLELTKLKPSLVPRAIVLAISGMFQDFLPSLSPTARGNLASWLAFHLANTEYQWPKALWDQWAPFTSIGRKRNSRGDFVTYVLHSMAGMSSDGTIAVVKNCLPTGSLLVQNIFLVARDNKNSPQSAESDLIDRFWNTSQDPDTIRKYIISDELTNSHDAIDDQNEDCTVFHSNVWWRTRMTTRAILYPMSQSLSRMTRLIEKECRESSTGDKAMMRVDQRDDEINETEDLISDLLDAVKRYKPVILAALARDADTCDSMLSRKVEDDQLLLAGEVSILIEFGDTIPSWDSATFNILIQCLLKNTIVSALAVATWALGEHSTPTISVSCNWWKPVSLAIYNAITSSLSSLKASSTDLDSGIGMVIDDSCVIDVDPHELAIGQLEVAMNLTVPVLKYVVDRVVQILEAENCVDKRIPVIGATLSDGTKRLFSAVLFMFDYHFSLAPPSGLGRLNSVNVSKGFAIMDLSWEKMALSFLKSIPTCSSEQSKNLLQGLGTSFEKMV